MAAVEGQQTEQQRQEEERKEAEHMRKIMMRRRCVSPSRVAALETLVHELGRRLCTVEECLLGMDSMRGRMFQLEKSMESALDRIMPRLDALLAGLPASAHSQIAAKPSIFPPFPPFPSPTPSPTPTTASASAPTPTSPAGSISGTPPATARSKAGSGSVSSCGVCHSKAGCSCAKSGTAAATTVVGKEKSNAAPASGKERSVAVHASGKERNTAAPANVKEKNATAPASVKEKNSATPASVKEKNAVSSASVKERNNAAAASVKERNTAAPASIKERNAVPAKVTTVSNTAATEKQPARAAAVVSEKEKDKEKEKEKEKEKQKEKEMPLEDNKTASEPSSAASLSTPAHILEGLEKQLRDAASRGDVVTCQKIMLKGVDSKRRDPATGDTPLHLAARQGHLGCIMLLLAVAKNAATCSNKQRQTPLMVAAASGQVASVQLLLHQARSCGTVRQGGPKALRQAATDGKDDILQALLDGGVSPHPEDNSASNPSALHMAAANGHTACVRLLIEHSADVALTNSEGQTALHKAAMNGHSECVAALLAAGSNPLEKDTSGWEALHLAARAGHTECVKLVLAYGVELCRSPTCRLTPLAGVGSGSERLEVEEKLLSTAAALGKPAGESA